MEREISQKYYDLIVDLIKEHPKYTPEYQDILDAIAEDVISHSRVVIDSITNESVIESYLNKVVTTSVITIPKKLNRKTRPNKNIESILNSARTKTQEVIQETAPAVEFTDNTDIETSTSSTSLLDDIEEIYESSVEKEDELEYVEDSIEEIYEEKNYDIEDDSEDDSSNVEIEEFCDEFVDIEEEEEEEEISEINYQENDKFETFEIESEEDFISKDAEPAVDKSLVDKMINGIGNNDTLENTDNIESDDDIEEYTEEREEEFLDNDISSMIDDFTNEIEENNDEDVIEGETELLTEDNNLETLEETPFDVLDESNEESEIFDLDQAEDIEEIEDIISSTETGPLEEAANVNNIENIKEFRLPDYSYFNFVPTLANFSRKEIVDSLKELIDKHSDDKIAEIYDLKYNKSKSVTEIAQTLNMDIENVISTLNDIIDTVKD